MTQEQELILNLADWIERRKADIGPYADHIIHSVRHYEDEISALRAASDQKTLSQEDITRRLTYNPETGVFTWAEQGQRVKVGEVAGSVNGHGYRLITLDHKPYPAHRLAWVYCYGEWPKGQIDHINGDRSDNRIKNLRDVPQSVNGKNVKISAANTSGVVGVSWHNKYKRWQASITVDGKKKHLGSFVDKSAAIAARRDAEKALGFHENHGKRECERVRTRLKNAQDDAFTEIAKWAEKERQVCNSHGDREGSVAYRRLYLRVREAQADYQRRYNAMSQEGE